jgi:hypothetical protein
LLRRSKTFVEIKFENILRALDTQLIEAKTALMHGAELTHPVYAALDHPLYRKVAVAQLTGVDKVN